MFAVNVIGVSYDLEQLAPSGEVPDEVSDFLSGLGLSFWGDMTNCQGEWESPAEYVIGLEVKGTPTDAIITEYVKKVNDLLPQIRERLGEPTRDSAQFLSIVS